MAEVVSFSNAGILNILGMACGTVTYDIFTGYNVTDEDPSRTDYDDRFFGGSRSGNTIDGGAHPQLVDPGAYNIVEAGFSNSNGASYVPLINVTGTSDAVTNSVTSVYLNLTFER